MADQETEDRPLGWAGRLAVVAACAPAVVLGLFVLGRTVDAEGALVDLLLERGAPEWAVSLGALGEAFAPFAVALGGLALTLWVGGRVADLVTGQRRERTSAEPEGEGPATEDEDPDEDDRPWPLHLVEGVGMLVLTWGALGLVALPWDVADHRRAEMLAREGRSVEATDVRVEVGTPWYVEAAFAEPEVRHVQVRISGVAGGGWVDLTGLLQPGLGDDVVSGWQPGSDALWYGPPLEVLHVVDGDEVHAMAAEDVSERLATGVVVEPVLPAMGLLLVLLSRTPAFLARLRANRSRAPGGRHRAVA